MGNGKTDILKGLGNGKMESSDSFNGKYPKEILSTFIASNACSEIVLPVVFFIIWFADEVTAACITDDVVKPEVAGPRNANGTI